MAVEPEPGTGAPELGIFPGAGSGDGAQNKYQKKPELSLKFRTGAGPISNWEVAPAPGPFLDTNSFATLTQN